MRISSSSSLFLLPWRKHSSGRGSARCWARRQRGSVCPNSAITQLSSAASGSSLPTARAGRGGCSGSRVEPSIRTRESTARDRPRRSAFGEGKRARGQTAAAVPSPPVPGRSCAPGHSVSALSKGLHARSDLTTFIPCSAGW